MVSASVFIKVGILSILTVAAEEIEQCVDSPGGCAAQSEGDSSTLMQTLLGVGIASSDSDSVVEKTEAVNLEGSEEDDTLEDDKDEEKDEETYDEEEGEGVYDAKVEAELLMKDDMALEGSTEDDMLEDDEDEEEDEDEAEDDEDYDEESTKSRPRRHRLRATTYTGTTTTTTPPYWAPIRDEASETDKCLWMTSPSPSQLFPKQTTPTEETVDNRWLSVYPGSVIKALKKGCPPWSFWLPSRKTFCLRDSANLAVRHIRPNNRCGPYGECLGASCVIFNAAGSNTGTFYPENSTAGFCIPAGSKVFGLGYIEHTILSIRLNYWDWIMATRWAQQDSPEVLTCQSFCTEGPTPNKDSRWSGQHGLCKCHCVSGSSAGQFDRCTSVSKQVCTDAQYCGGHGTATWTKNQNSKCDDEGQCSCACKGGWSGRSCNLAPDTPCDMNDCSHLGSGNGTRPNCNCHCASHFHGSDCSKADWGGKTHHVGGTSALPLSNLFTYRRDACLDSARLCRRWAGRRLCSRWNIHPKCAKSCNTKPSCKYMPDNWWVLNRDPPAPAPPSLAPTVAPTAIPTVAPTEAPPTETSPGEPEEEEEKEEEAPTEAPTETTPTESPTPAPTDAPTDPPTEAAPGEPRFGTCWTSGFGTSENDMAARDAACQGDLVCARKGYDGRDFGDCSRKHCCSQKPDAA